MNDKEAIQGLQNIKEKLWSDFVAGIASVTIDSSEDTMDFLSEAHDRGAHMWTGADERYMVSRMWGCGTTKSVQLYCRHTDIEWNHDLPMWYVEHGWSKYEATFNEFMFDQNASIDVKNIASMFEDGVM